MDARTDSGRRDRRSWADKLFTRQEIAALRLRLLTCRAAGRRDMVRAAETLYLPTDLLDGLEHYLSSQLGEVNRKRLRDGHLREAAEQIDGSEWTRARALCGLASRLHRGGVASVDLPAGAVESLRAAALAAPLPATPEGVLAILRRGDKPGRSGGGMEA